MAWIVVSKLEMTRLLKGEAFVPVTLVKFPVTKIAQIKTVATDGYEAVVLASTFGKRTEMHEVPLTGALASLKAGDDVTIDVLDGIETLTIRGTSKGKGFAGAMKRHNFSGGPGGHGSKFHRALGSIGTRKPRRTKPGQRMHGHMGTDTVTLKKVPVELVNKELGIIAVRGPVPGARNSVLVFNF